MPEICYPPYPETTSKIIGWLSSRPEFNLEKFGRDWNLSDHPKQQFNNAYSKS